MPNSSRFAACGNLTFRVMGGKSGKNVATMWQGLRQKRQGLVGIWGYPRRYARGCTWVRWAGLRKYAVVKVLAWRGGRAMMELIYHEVSGMSRGAAVDCRAGEGSAAMRGV